MNTESLLLLFLILSVSSASEYAANDDIIEMVEAAGKTVFFRMHTK